MKIRYYVADAFTDRPFHGNPAGVCLLEKAIDDETMQNIAFENNLSETAFLVRKAAGQYNLRWFTPEAEIDLCGHATLATAFVLFNHENHEGDVIQFHSHRSGALPVTRNGALLTLNFPTDVFEPIELTAEILDCFHRKPTGAFKGKTDFMVVFDTEEAIKINRFFKLVTLKSDKVHFPCTSAFA